MTVVSPVTVSRVYTSRRRAYDAARAVFTSGVPHDIEIYVARDGDIYLKVMITTDEQDRFEGILVYGQPVDAVPALPFVLEYYAGKGVRKFQG